MFGRSNKSYFRICCSYESRAFFSLEILQYQIQFSPFNNVNKNRFLKILTISTFLLILQQLGCHGNCQWFKIIIKMRQQNTKEPLHRAIFDWRLLNFFTVHVASIILFFCYIPYCSFHSLWFKIHLSFSFFSNKHPLKCRSSHKNIFLLHVFFIWLCLQSFR